MLENAPLAGRGDFTRARCERETSTDLQVSWIYPSKSQIPKGFCESSAVSSASKHTESRLNAPVRSVPSTDLRRSSPPPGGTCVHEFARRIYYTRETWIVKPERAKAADAMYLLCLDFTLQIRSRISSGYLWAALKGKKKRVPRGLCGGGRNGEGHGKNGHG